MTRLPPIKRFRATSGARIYSIPCQVLPVLSGRVHLILGGDMPVLVDAGGDSPMSVQQILAGIDHVRETFSEAIRPGDIRQILLTHTHIDHFGGLAEIVRLSGAAVAVHALDSRIVSDYDERAAMANVAFGRFLDLAGVEPSRRDHLLRAFGYRPGRIESVAIDRLLEDGDEIDGITAIHTPGHSSGHLCFQIGDILLSGDHILAQTVSQQWPESIAPELGIRHYLHSLDRIAALENVELILAAHERPVRDIPERIEEIRHSHHRRLDRLRDILRRAPQPFSVDDASERMYSGQKGFRQLLALCDTGARIEYLDQLGELSVANIEEAAGAAVPVYRYRYRS